MNTRFDILQRITISRTGLSFNSHELRITDNGSRALVLYNRGENRPREESLTVGYDGRCHVGCNGIYEWDTSTWKKTFEWDSCGKIMLDESTANKGNLTELCSRDWDYVHLNSIDKTSDGNLLVSCRHCDAIYKISYDTGDIIWRLGGVKNDFSMADDFIFTRQHNIRYLGENRTHTIVSMLDNATGEDEQPPSYPFSRGLILALDERSDPMTAAIVQQYDHPDGDNHHSIKRGNLQVLENGNILMGWSERARITEHTPDGTIVMEAKLQPVWLGTYRSYKFAFAGFPSQRPRAAGEASDADVEGGAQTTMYASWNGATEVAECESALST